MSTTTSIEPLRRSARILTRSVAPDLVQVSTPDRVLGFVRSDRDSYVALRGTDPRWADELGRYISQGLALEALRLRKRSV
ncbi:hypothetical protein [Frigoribacterium sp. CFBP 13707]|uniref:hypothetical protein n=1 Tax=Frigoribacterium sp. CFBP 13707 TaxID=2775313 RepID=UPI0017863491|nr:hypothetical protein [Frigoribacterium sp. CFBP 13707]MBD8727336.1 hypothetical protein [Frigoribacterium sp. CFBP 13707]